MLSFSELELKTGCNITEECIKHSAQSGSVFPLRAQYKKALEVATDNVKNVRARLSLEIYQAGAIPDGKGGAIKVTGASADAYVDAHPEMAQAREERAIAEENMDAILGLVTAYNAKKDLLSMIMSDRKNEFYSDATGVTSQQARAIN